MGRRSASSTTSWGVLLQIGETRWPTLRPGAEVRIHFEHLDYIDHACLDLLSSWEKQHEVTGGTLIIEWEELSSKFHQRRTGAQKTFVRIAA